VIDEYEVQVATFLAQAIQFPDYK